MTSFAWQAVKNVQGSNNKRDAGSKGILLSDALARQSTVLGGPASPMAFLSQSDHALGFAQFEVLVLAAAELLCNLLYEADDDFALILRITFVPSLWTHSLGPTLQRHRQPSDAVALLPRALCNVT